MEVNGHAIIAFMERCALKEYLGIVCYLMSGGKRSGVNGEQIHILTRRI